MAELPDKPFSLYLDRYGNVLRKLDDGSVLLYSIHTVQEVRSKDLCRIGPLQPISIRGTALTPIYFATMRAALGVAI